jgi:hypothetical protein
MSIGYNAVGGIGIKVTSEIIQALINKDVFTQSDYDEYGNECLEGLGLKFEVSGNMYTDEIQYYFILEGNDLEELIANYVPFRKKFNELTDITLNPQDFKIFSELYIS